MLWEAALGDLVEDRLPELEESDPGLLFAGGLYPSFTEPPSFGSNIAVGRSVVLFSVCFCLSLSWMLLFVCLLLFACLALFLAFWRVLYLRNIGRMGMWEMLFGGRCFSVETFYLSGKGVTNILGERVGGSQALT